MKNILNLSVDNAEPLNDTLTMIKTISNRLFVALSCLLMTFIVGGYLFFDGHITVGVTTWMVMLVGFVGGFVGLQRRLKELSDDDLRLLAQSWVYVVLSPMVGGILALLVYILFISGLLDGDLFPSFEATVTPESEAEGDGIADSAGTEVAAESALPVDGNTEAAVAAVATADASAPPQVVDTSPSSVGLASLFHIHAVAYKDYAKLIVWCFIAGYSERFVTDIISHFERVGTPSDDE